MSGSTNKVIIKEYSLGDYAKVKVVYDKVQGFTYVVNEPELSRGEKEVLERVKGEVLEKADVDLWNEAVFSKVSQKLIRKYFRKVVKRKPSEEEVKKLYYYIKRDMLGFGKLDVPLKDPNIEDIHVLGVKKPVFVWYTQYDLIPTNIVLETSEELQTHIQKILFYSGKHISYTKPIIDGTLPSGFRVHVVHHSVSTSGTQVVIRKHRRIPFSVLDLIKLGVAPPEVFVYLWFLVENKRSVLIIGETASGKTTLLNAIASLIPFNMKIVVVEEVRELRLPHPNVSYLVTKEAVDSVGKVTLFDLVKASVRQRPDYIIVGEIRGEEAYALFQAMTLGHSGLGTMHAESPTSAIKRLMMKPLNIPTYMLKELDTIVHITKYKVKEMVLRYVVTVADLLDIDEKTLEPKFTYIYRFSFSDLGAKKEINIGNSAVIKKLSEQKGIPTHYFIEEIKRRKEFLMKLVKKNLSYEDMIREIIAWGRAVA